jgi:hypothetical protein
VEAMKSEKRAPVLPQHALHAPMPHRPCNIHCATAAHTMEHHSALSESCMCSTMPEQPCQLTFAAYRWNEHGIRICTQTEQFVYGVAGQSSCTLVWPSFPPGGLNLPFGSELVSWLVLIGTRGWQPAVASNVCCNDSFIWVHFGFPLGCGMFMSSPLGLWREIGLPTNGLHTSMCLGFWESHLQAA